MRDPLDYAPHTLAVQHGLKELRDLLLNKDYDGAVEQAKNMIIELRFAIAAINDIKDHQR